MGVTNHLLNGMIRVLAGSSYLSSCGWSKKSSPLKMSSFIFGLSQNIRRLTLAVIVNGIRLYFLMEVSKVSRCWFQIFCIW